MAQTVSSAARPFRFERKTPTKYYVVDRKGARPAPGLNGRIEFRDVAFEYVPGQPVLSDINLTIEPGERIALVGATGAGKSTFVSLIPRFYDPTRGAVCADEFIQRLPDGYESHVAERGATLFGGQKQRIAIARAILRDAPILILDEPTSGVDAVAESMVIDALERASAARTTFMIVHRLSTVRFANRILVFDKGRIVEQALTNNSSPATAATPASITCKQPHAEKHLLNYV